MSIRPGRIDGVFVLTPRAQADERGWFVELYAERNLPGGGRSGPFVRSAISHNRHRGTLRGLHFQKAPHQDAKLVTCLSGALFDVVVDIRVDSPTYGRWEAFELTSDTHQSVVIPEGVAHGFQTLADDTALLYHIGAYYEASASGGIRWDDPALAISWPLVPTVMSDQDRAWGTLVS